MGWKACFFLLVINNLSDRPVNDQGYWPHLGQALHTVSTVLPWHLYCNYKLIQKEVLSPFYCRIFYINPFLLSPLSSNLSTPEKVPSH